MRSIGLVRVTLGSVSVPRVALGGRKGRQPKPPLWDIDNLLLEDTAKMLTESGGDILLEVKINQIKLNASTKEVEI